jgi:hypothetical protein
MDSFSDKDMHHVLPVVQTICNFSSGPNSYIEHILNADLLSTIWWYTTPEIPYLLRRNSILTISNVAAGHQLIVKKVVENKFIMENILKYLQVPGHAYHVNACKWEPSVDAINHHSTEEWKITKEVLWVLSNITNLADDTTIS